MRADLNRSPTEWVRIPVEKDSQFAVDAFLISIGNQK